MVTTTKVGLVLEMNLRSGFYYRGECLDEDENSITILDKNKDRIEIVKSAILVCREVHND